MYRVGALLTLRGYKSSESPFLTLDDVIRSDRGTRELRDLRDLYDLGNTGVAHIITQFCKEASLQNALKGEGLLDWFTGWSPSNGGYSHPNFNRLRRLVEHDDHSDDTFESCCRAVHSRLLAQRSDPMRVLAMGGALS